LKLAGPLTGQRREEVARMKWDELDPRAANLDTSQITDKEMPRSMVVPPVRTINGCNSSEQTRRSRSFFSVLETKTFFRSSAGVNGGWISSRVCDRMAAS